MWRGSCACLCSQGASLAGATSLQSCAHAWHLHVHATVQVDAGKGRACLHQGGSRSPLHHLRGSLADPARPRPTSNLRVAHSQSRGSLQCRTLLACLQSLCVCSGASGRPRGTTSSRPTFARSWSSCTRRSAIASFQGGCKTDHSRAVHATAERERYPWLCANLIAANSSAPLPCRHPPTRRCSPSWR